MLEKILIISTFMVCIFFLSPCLTHADVETVPQNEIINTQSDDDVAGKLSDICVHLENVERMFMYLLCSICFICLCIVLYIVFKSFTLF